MYFIPELPLQLNALVLFGILLLAGLIFGEITRRIKFLPQIFGYTIAGFLLSPSVLNIINQTAIEETRIFIQISLGLIMFDLGRYLDFRWLRHDLGILYSSLTESLLTFILVYILLRFFDFPMLPALLAATFAIATSPAVVMLVARDLNANGPVTRRTLILTSLNNFFSMVLFSILLPFTLTSVPSELYPFHAGYRLIGSIILGLTTFLLIKYIAHLTQKIQIKQFVLVIGIVMLTIGLANLLQLSTLLSLFVLGVAVRNFDKHHNLMEIDIAWLARPFIIILFVISGFYLQFQGLWLTSAVVIAFILVRMLAKFVGVYLFAKSSRISKQQSSNIALALTPMGGAAIGMYSILEMGSPELTHQLAIIITAVLTVLNLVGPIAAQFAFIRANETEKE
ncbi:MAG: cation:proton antiporter [Legionellales bacterium]|jgi:Kef-type K+ transport system membrane component KefB